jgi:altronate hydrolase
MRHPNAGGVLVLGLGCENNQLDALLAEAGDVDRSRIRFFNTQDVFDEVAVGRAAARTSSSSGCATTGARPCRRRRSCWATSAAARTGSAASRRTRSSARRRSPHAPGRTVLLTEVPEMFGAERVLMNRAASECVYPGRRRRWSTRSRNTSSATASRSTRIRRRGNKAGGLTTLEEKSLGAIQKGGSSTVTSRAAYGSRCATPGLALLEAPGNDGVSSTAMVASGATVLCFTTGRGTPLGFPAPTIKVASNSEIARKKPHWIDFDAGRLLADPGAMDRSPRAARLRARRGERQDLHEQRAERRPRDRHLEGRSHALSVCAPHVVAGGRRSRCRVATI